MIPRLGTSPNFPFITRLRRPQKGPGLLNASCSVFYYNSDADCDQKNPAENFRAPAYLLANATAEIASGN